MSCSGENVVTQLWLRILQQIAPILFGYQFLNFVVSSRRLILFWVNFVFKFKISGFWRWMCILMIWFTTWILNWFYWFFVVHKICKVVLRIIFTFFTFIFLLLIFQIFDWTRSWFIYVFFFCLTISSYSKFMLVSLLNKISDFVVQRHFLIFNKKIYKK